MILMGDYEIISNKLFAAESNKNETFFL